MIFKIQVFIIKIFSLFFVLNTYSNHPEKMLPFFYIFFILRLNHLFKMNNKVGLSLVYLLYNQEVVILRNIPDVL